MPNRPRILLAGALAALALVGCTSAPPEEQRPAEPTAVGSATAESRAPAVAEDKRQQAQTLAEQAEKVMLDPALAPREKYPQALKMFREALEIDPDNALSKRSITLIEDIYKSMGRPVPD